MFLWMIYSIMIIFLTSNNLFVDIRSAIWWPSVYFVFYEIFIRREARAEFQFSSKIDERGRANFSLIQTHLSSALGALPARAQRPVVKLTTLTNTLRTQ